MNTRSLGFLIFVLAAAGVGYVGWRAMQVNYDSTVQGAVTIDGELANRGTVIFHPVGKGAPAYGDIRKDGTYSLRVGQGDLSNADGGQLASGDYVVTVMVTSAPPGDTGDLPMPGPRVTAAKYREKSTSDLKVSVKPGPNVVPLDLEGAAAEPPSAAVEEKSEPAGDDAPSEDSSDEDAKSDESSTEAAAEGDAR
jgi:hypothetical protein